MVRLVPMTDIEYPAFLALAVCDYADEKVAAGSWQSSEALGFDTIALHVSGHNQAGRALYEKMGYEITNINMAKKLTA